MPIPYDNSPELTESCEKELNLSTSDISLKLATAQSFAFFPVGLARRNQFHFFSLFDKFNFVVRNAVGKTCDGKTVAICNCHESLALAHFRKTRWKSGGGND